MATFAAADGGLREAAHAFFVARAKGGAGLIVCGNLQPSAYLGRSAYGGFYLPEHGAKMRLLATDVHSYEAKLCLQFGYGQGRCGAVDPAAPPYAASPLPALLNPQVQCRELPREAIRALVRDTASAARLARASGVDAVMLQAYAGYLLDQFQSAEWNRRTDEYGGSVVNRLRFTCELIAAIHESCGADFPVLVKFTLTHNTAHGRRLAEGLEMCRLLEEAGAAALLLDTGCYEETWYRSVPTVYSPEGFALPQIKAAKQVLGIPVIGQGKLADPLVAARALEERNCDFVALGHALLADPDWPRKTRLGLTETIRPCIGCNHCYAQLSREEDYRCAVNPQLFHENDPAYCLTPVQQPCNVLVVGGGPSGVSAALLAAERGCSVQLWEAGPAIGGNLLAAAIPSFKQDVARYLTYLQKLLWTSSVTVRLNQEARFADILAGNFQKIILATGARSQEEPPPGSECKHVLSAVEYLAGPALAEQKLVVIGGGLVGCETALYARQRGAAVTILEAASEPSYLSQEARNNALALSELLAAGGVELIRGVWVRLIDDAGVHYQQEGRAKLAVCDTVVLAKGFLPRQNLARDLTTAGIDFMAVGDCIEARKLTDAVREGIEAALAI